MNKRGEKKTKTKKRIYIFFSWAFLGFSSLNLSLSAKCLRELVVFLTRTWTFYDPIDRLRYILAGRPDGVSGYPRAWYSSVS